MRQAGVLMPLASLPGEYGVGELGKSAYEFVDIISKGGATIWQILPLNPLGYGNSPYQPYSSMAGDEIYISLEKLYEDGYLNNIPKSFNKEAKSIEYEQIRKYKEKYLKEAFKNFKEDAEYNDFIKQEWVFLYGVFRTFKTVNNMKCWNEWDVDYKNYINSKDETLILKHKEEIEYNMFLQFVFYKQWISLKEYANSKNIKIMGDIPFYVGIDSLDVYANQKNFLLDENGVPTFIAGVPPDYFSKTGQRWGNPIYNWEYLEDNNFKFWIERLAYNNKLFDIIRIDHFRAFDTFWKIPVSCKTAIDGEWIEAPGYKVFDEIYKALPDICIVAEDLGDLRPEVTKLKNHYKLKGMKIVQFTFDPEENNNDFVDIENMIIYTGTHDNQTIRGWYEGQNKSIKKKTSEYLAKEGFKDLNITNRFLRYTLNNIAQLAIIPVQDILDLNDSARLNTPGTVGSPNWEWRLPNYTELNNKIQEFRKIVIESKRM